MRRTLFPVFLIAALAACSLLEPSRTCSGDYSYDELETFFEKAGGVLGVPGVQSLDHDEVRGCVVVGVLEGTDRDAVRDRLRELAVPLDAVLIKQKAPIRFL